MSLPAPKLGDFDYHLPPDLIAQHPARRRSDSRMLVVDRTNGSFQDSTFRQLPDHLKSGDLLALNNSRVLPARLLGYRVGLSSQVIGKNNPAGREYLTSPIEVLLTHRLDERTWEALVKPGRKVRIGEKLIFDNAAGGRRDLSGKKSKSGKKLERIAIGMAKGIRPASDGGLVSREKGPVLEADIIGRAEYGIRILRFAAGVAIPEMLEKVGHIPLPPYIRRPDEVEDRLRYQTVYARHPGSVAAPTAGLHFTDAMLSRLQKCGVERAEITLHVGLGTFQPIHSDAIERHRMHPESYEVTPQAAARLNQALAEKRRIVAVGTTTVRTLEHLAAEHGGAIEPGSGETCLFILPGFEFRVVGGLLTNFHLPRTTLLMLIAAFAGRELIMDAYEHAVRERYRFYSYGDCMLIV